MEVYEKNKELSEGNDPSCIAYCNNGSFIGVSKEGVTAFKGIPYALPPVGPLRWKEPVPAPDADGFFEALHYGSSAIQTEIESERASYYHQNEDCLYLNVWTADKYQGEKRPVMVFIHGGNYGWGGTSDPLYDGHQLIKKFPEVVLVTIAYRIGIMGFVDLSRVSGGEKYQNSGNLGLLDQICALEYIKKNIKNFGGDPDRVTIFGESAGAGSVSLLPLIPKAKGLFSQCIAESGSVALSYSKRECRSYTKLLMKETGASGMDDLLALTEDELKAINERMNDHNCFPERDGKLLPLNLYRAYDKGNAAPIRMMIGTNADELRYWIHDLGSVGVYRIMSRLLIGSTLRMMKKKDRKTARSFLSSLKDDGQQMLTWRITEFFNEIIFRLPAVRQALAHASHGNDVYMYYWKYPSSLPYMGACHAVELSYVFNNLQETIYTGKDVNEKLADKVQRMWVNFAVTGDPSIPEVRWDKYNASSKKTMILDSVCHMETDLKADQEEKLMPLTRYGFNGNPDEVKRNWKIWR